jgi:transposase
MSSLILPWVDASLMTLFLSHTAATFPNDHCVVLMDRAGWHIANDLVVPPSMTLLSLPPYSPECNPAEQIWKYTRSNDLRNRTFASLDDVVSAVSGSLHTLHTNPELVRSMTAFDWIKTLRLT